MSQHLLMIEDDARLASMVAKYLEQCTSDLLALTQCTSLCARLIEGGVEDLHFYTLNRPNLTREVVRALGIAPEVALEKVA